YIIKNQKPFLIEENTIPGLTKERIIPQQDQAAGLTLEKLFDMSIDHAIKKNK
ncbi:MAG: D-alanine--D-alanine ligase A, partial [Flavobacteriales bacterium]|nr:D-alanine--D-alanine ligase A [Flavobacteriales bacterium]